MKILIVDDEESIRELYKDYLQKLKVEQILTFSQDGIEGLMRCLVEKFDVILLDYKMPRMNGVDLLTALRGNGINKDTPIIMISGELGNIEFAPKDLPDTYFLQKPINFKKLEDAILSFV